MADTRKETKKDAPKETEQDKARGTTEAQKALKAYHEGDFQTTDPVTGEPRGATGGNWQDEDTVAANTFENDPLPDAPKGDSDSEVDATDAARDLAEEEGVDLSKVKGTGEGGRITVGDVKAAKK